jgi:hypothetical protein
MQQLSVTSQQCDAGWAAAARPVRPPPSRDTRLEWLGFGAVIAGFAATRLLAWLAGVRFDATPLDYFAQLLDPPLLRDDLLRSLWYLHAQPPLLNLIAGVALKLSPARPGIPLHVLFVAAGLVSCLAMFAILRLLRFRRRIAAVAAVVMIGTPPFILHEHVSFYSHPAQALVLCAGWALLASAGRPGRALHAAVWLLAALVLLRSIFHPAYLLAAVGAVAVLLPSADRIRMLRGAALPVAVVMIWALKNLVVFGFFGMSSWGGNSLHRTAKGMLDRPTLEHLVETGRIPPLSLVWEFAPPERYLEVLAVPRRDWGVPALDQTGKTASSENPVNYNHWVYPMASGIYAGAALRLIREEPRAYLRAVRWSGRRFLDPVTDDGIVLARNRDRIQGAVRALRTLETTAVYRLALLMGWAGALVAGLRRRGSPGERLFLLYAAGTILWVAAVGSAVEFGENNRFRYLILGLSWILVLAIGRDLITGARRLSMRWRRDANEPPTVVAAQPPGERRTVLR